MIDPNPLRAGADVSVMANITVGKLQLKGIWFLGSSYNLLRPKCNLEAA